MAEAEDAMIVDESEAAQVVQEDSVFEEPAAATTLLNATVTLDDAKLGEPEPDVTQVL